MNKKESKAKFSLNSESKTSLFNFWLIGSVVAFMILTHYDTNFAIIIFGQLFLGLGISTFKSMGKISIPAIMCMLAGVYCIITPVIQIFGGIFNFNMDWDLIIPLLIISFFVFIIIIMLISSIIISKKENEIHKVKVRAKVTDYDHIIDNAGNVLYCPIYSFEFEGVKYQVPGSMYSGTEKLPIGTIRTFRIDPDNLNQVIDDTQANVNIIGLVIILLIPLSILIFIAMNF